MIGETLTRIAAARADIKAAAARLDQQGRDAIAKLDLAYRDAVNGVEAEVKIAKATLRGLYLDLGRDEKLLEQMRDSANAKTQQDPGSQTGTHGSDAKA